MNLEIQHLSGDTELRPLAIGQSVSIGRAESCDIRVDEEEVGQMHCRISWNGSSWEIQAANLDGVEVNGQMIRETDLGDGDVIRVGSLDVRLSGDADDAKADESEGFMASLDTSDGEIGLMPLDEDELPVGKPTAGDMKKPERPVVQPPPAAQARPQPKPKRRDPEPAAANDEHPINQIFEDDDMFDDLDDDEDEPVRSLPGHEVQARPRPDDDEDLPKDPPEAKKPEGTRLGLSERLQVIKRRPGEQETLKSPLVLILGGSAFVLLIASATFWFMFSRNTIEGLFEIASAEVEEGSFSQAIAHLEEFLQLYPNNEEFSPQATFLLNQARVEARLGGTKEWVEALAAIDVYRKECQDLENYDPEKKIYLFNTMVDIAIGSANEGGESLRDTKAGRGLLELSVETGRKLSLYKTDEEKFDADQVRIEQARKDAAAKLLQQEVLDGGLATITTALEAKKPMDVLIERRRLLTRYEEFGSVSVLESELQKALSLEQSLVTSDKSPRPSVTEDSKPSGIASLSLTLNTRVRTDEKSEGRTVFVVGRDCFYGIDTVTGHPVWRRIIGLDLPFVPVAVATADPGLLLVDTNRYELVLVRQQDGKATWRLPLKDDQQVAGIPLVTGGQIYLVTESNGRGQISKISLETGVQSMQLSFSQPVTAPPVLISGGKQIVVAGHREVIYTVALGGFTCESVSYLGHPAGSIESPLLAMGGLVLLPQNGQSAAADAKDSEGADAGESGGEATEKPAADAEGGGQGENLVVAENDRLDSCLLKVIRLTANGTQLAAVAEVRVPGHVRDRAMLRGRDLFVPLSGERLVAFTVSDDPNHDALTTVGTHQVETPHAGAIHLSVGPGGFLWMASSKLQRFQLTTDSIKVDPNRIAAGLSSQPLQSIGSQLFVGRRLAHSASVIFTRVERDASPQMVTHWRTVVGSGLIECQRMSNGLLLCLTETGGLFHVRDNELDVMGFKFNIEGELRLPVGLASPLGSVRFSDGRVAVWCGLPEPRLWILNTVGTIEQEIDLQKEPLEAPPVLTEGGIVAPLPGRLKLVARTAGQGPAREFTAPVEGGKKRRWVKTVGIDSKHLLVLDGGGDLVRLEYRTAPAPHLYPISKIKLGTPLDRDLLVHRGQVVLATSDRKLQLLGAADLQVVANVDLPAAATAGPWAVGNRVLVETGRKQLMCLDPADNLKVLWTSEINGHSVAGSPLSVDGRLMIAFDDGRVVVVNSADGQVGRSVELGQPVALGPRAYGKKILVSSIDGTLYRIESLLAAEPAGGGE